MKLPLIACAMVGAVALAPAVAPSGATASRRSAGAPAGVIKHVVIIYQENHSFDETLGDYCITRHHRCDGSIGPVTLEGGSTVMLTKSPDVIDPDPPHDVPVQAEDIDGGRMDGWNVPGGCTAHGVNLCLTYYTPDQVPSLTTLADSYAVSDRTFSMQDSPSWGGHLYAAAATIDGFLGGIPLATQGEPPGPGWGCDSNRSTGWVDPATGHLQSEPSCIPAPDGVLNPRQYPYGGAFRATPVPNVPTIFDRLDANNDSWKLYSNIYIWSICPSFAECLDTPQHDHVVDTKSVLDDAHAGRLPSFSIVLPSGPGSTAQHPPASMMVGDNWIGKVVHAIQSGPDWSSTAIFITYDDCGCFYDHVPPGTNPDGTPQGPRVPMVIVSPYARRGFTDSRPATFASMLRFTEEAFGLPPLSANDASAYDYSDAFAFGAPAHLDAPALPPHPVPASSRQYIATHPGPLGENEDT